MELVCRMSLIIAVNVVIMYFVGLPLCEGSEEDIYPGMANVDGSSEPSTSSIGSLGAMKKPWMKKKQDVAKPVSKVVLEGTFDDEW